MSLDLRRWSLVAACGAWSALAAGVLWAAPTAEQALALKPIQAQVDYDRPTAEQAAKATLAPESGPGLAGWVVRGAAGETLRRFLDTNGDSKIDIWAYFANGIEVYRDIDSDFNGKADQYRWLGTEGTRWGLDPDEDGKIDTWKSISAEEVTQELVEALRTRDAVRFQRLLLTTTELEALGVGPIREKDLAGRIAEAPANFAEATRTQSVVAAESKWLNFAAAPPGVIPSGTEESTKDLIVYENVTAVVETEGKNSQLHVGTLVQTPGGWRLIEFPKNLNIAGGSTGLFFTIANRRVEAATSGMNEGLSPEEQKIIGDLEGLETRLAAAATPKEKGELCAKKADLMQRMAALTKSAEIQANWLRQLADTLQAGVQSGGYDAGLARLQALSEMLVEKKASDDLAAYVKFRFLTSEYSVALQDDANDYAKVQEKWLASLEQFVTQYPKASDAAEAMLQLALAQEFAGKDDEAKKYYARIVGEFPEGLLAKKAAGAAARLDSVGKVLPLVGATLDGRAFNLAAFKGRVVAIHYWATWCEPCKQDMQQLKALLAKYGERGFSVVGINLDNEKPAAATYIAQTKLPWAHLFETGGLDSRLATELGVFTLPTMILVDEQGKVVNRSLHIGELEKELARRLK